MDQQREMRGVSPARGQAGAFAHPRDGALHRLRNTMLVITRARKASAEKQWHTAPTSIRQACWRSASVDAANQRSQPGMRSNKACQVRLAASRRSATRGLQTRRENYTRYGQARARNCSSDQRAREQRQALAATAGTPAPPAATT